MNRIRKQLCWLLSLAMVFCLINLTPAFAYANEEFEAEEKVVSTATLEQNFADNRVLVVLSNEASLKFNSYDANDFAGLGVKSVSDLTQHTAVMAQAKAKQTSVSSLNNISGTADIDAINLDTYNQVICLELAETGKEKVLSTIQALQTRDDVIYAGPDYVMSVCSSTTTSNDPYSGEQWAITQTDLDQAWNHTTGSSTVTVGVLDTGIEGTHPDLVNRINTGLCRDFTSGTAVAVGTPTDPSGHGTLMAGVIGAQGNNNVGVSGVCWNVTLVSLRVFNELGYGYSSAVANAIDFAQAQGIPILNFSGTFYNMSEMDIYYYDWLLDTVIQNYSGLFVCSAGNRGMDNDVTPVYPGNYRLPNLISVGASDWMLRSLNPEVYSEELLVESNYGQTKVDIFAPGGGILSCYPSALCQAGHPTEDEDEPATIHYGATTTYGYHFTDGTSPAAAFVSGVAALLLSVNSNLTAAQLKTIIMDSAEVVYNYQGNNAFGTRCVSGGRLNAYDAICHVVHSHNYTHTYQSINKSQHYAYCSCGAYITENHTLESTSSGIVCTKCGYSVSIMKYDPIEVVIK